MPVLIRQTADDGLKKIDGISLLRQYEIPPEIEPIPSPKPEPLDTERVNESK